MTTGARRAGLRRSVVLTAIFGVLVTLVAYAWVRSAERERIVLQLRDAAAAEANDVQWRLSLYRQDLVEMGGAVAVSGSLNQRKLEAFARPVLEELPGLRAVWWVARERVGRGAARDHQVLVDDGAGGRATHGTRQHAGDRKARYPVRLLVSRAGNEGALGKDLGALPRPRAALQRARDSALAVAVGPVRLPGEARGVPGFLTLQPVYAGGGVPRGRAERAARLAGFLVGTFEAVPLLRFVAGKRTSALNLALSDNGRSIGSYSTGATTALSERLPVSFEGRRWQLHVTATPAFVARHSTSAPPLALMAGTALTFLLVLYALSQARGREAVSRLVAERTAELTSARDRLELALEGSCLALWDIDLANGNVYLSEHYSLMLGGPPVPTTMALAAAHTAVHPEDLAQVEQAMAAVLAGETGDYRCISRVRRADGTWMWTRHEGRVTERDAKGRPARILGTAADVDAEQGALQALAAKEREFNAITENVPALISRWDPDLRFRYASRHAAEFFGVTPDAMVGRPAAETLGEEAIAFLRPYVERALAGETVRYEREVPGPGGSRWLVATVHPDRDEQGKVWGVIVIALDATERKRQEERFRVVVEASPDAQVMVDGDGRIVLVNTRAERLFGYRREELVGQSVEMLVPEHLRELYVRQRAAALKATQHATVREREVLARRADGSVFEAQVRQVPVRSDDGLMLLTSVADITERKRAAEALAASEARFRSFAEIASDWFWETDAEMRFTNVSTNIQTALGVDPAGLLGRSHHQLRGADFSEPAWRRLDAALEGRLSFRNVEYSMQGGDGETLWVATSGAPVYDAAGSFTGYRGVGRDVTRRVEVEHKLARALARAEAAEQRLLTAIEALNDAFVLYDADDRLVMCNEIYRRYYAASADLIVPGARFEDIIREGARRGQYVEAKGRVEAWVAERMAVHRGANSSIEQQLDDGRWLQISERRTPDGGTVGVRVDITELKQANERLRTSNVRLERTVANMPMGVSVMDAELDIVAFNEGFLKLLDLPDDHFRSGDPLAKLLRLLAARGEFGPGEPDVLARERMEMVLRGEPYCFERTRADGNVLEVRGNPVPGGGFVTLYTDVTARKEFERKLIEAREHAEAAARAKSEFLALVSHEVRTPMNGVLGLAELLLDSELTPTQRGYVQTLHRSGCALLDILNDILDVSKIEAGKLALEHISFDLVQSVEDVAALWAPAAAEKGLELVVHLAERCPRHVRGDPGRIRQVLSNFVGNAIKFTATGYVLMAVEVAGVDDSETQLRFSVRDTGVGIDEAARERLFKPFSQADASTTRRYGGTGLGLVICKRLVEMMGGAIGFEATGAEGTEFWFTLTLPLCERSVPSVVPDLCAVGVLALDDHPVRCAALHAQLAGIGMRVYSAANRLQALDAVAAARAAGEPIRVAVIDQGTGEGGLALGRALHEHPGLAGLPLVLLASGSCEAETTAAETAGFTARLVKPVRADLLRGTIADVLGRTAAAAPRTSRLETETAARFSGSVLLVEDNAVNRMVARALLQRAGLEVVEAPDGRAGFECAMKQCFDLVLMDVHMPGMDGHAATRAIRANTARRVPIIAMTADVGTEVRAACEAAGMDGFLSKPVVHEELLAVLARWLEDGATPRVQATAYAGESAQTTEPLDATRLDTLQRMMGPAYGALIDTTLHDTAELLVALDVAARAGDARTLHRHAHTLKSSSANVGASALANEARTLEQAAAAGDLDGAAHSVEVLRERFARVQAALARTVTEPATETDDG